MRSAPTEIVLPSFAKLNLFLRVVSKRNDGYHELFTVFQTISLCDTLRFRHHNSVELICDDPSIPVNEGNLIVRAAHLLAQRFGVDRGAHITLTKRIPSPGGLGGGSSNAAVALIGLNKLWDLDATAGDLHQIAAKLGSDVPFFLYGGTAIGSGRGEVIEEIADISADEMLIVTPNVSVSTSAAFADLHKDALTIEAQNHILRDCRLGVSSLDLYHSAIENDFEASVFASHPEIERVKTELLELGAVKAGLSGSGASVFAVFDKQETRQAAERTLEREPTWRKFAVSTISRDQYREALWC